MKKTKFHWYPSRPEDQFEDAYGLTACGRKGKDVGGLITGFFKLMKTKDRCKICNKQYLERSLNGKAKIKDDVPRKNAGGEK